MSEEEKTVRTPTVIEFFRYLVDDDEAVASRRRYCAEVSKHFANVAMWLGLDAALGGGDLTDNKRVSGTYIDRDLTRLQAFMAVGLVAQIGSELIVGTLQLLESGQLYSGSALMRQLIECEYLLRVFQASFVEGSCWLVATDEERWDFTPSKLRKIIGFDQQEYSDHCNAGGHPNPKGGSLLDLQGRIQKLNRLAADEDHRPDRARILWLDFAFHCDRTWRSLNHLLLQEHARYGIVRADTIEAALQSFAEWDKVDPLAKNFGGLQSAMSDNPSLALDQLFR